MLLDPDFRVLAVVAHPDDEVLGAGGTLAALASMGFPVRVCMLSGRVGARQHRPELQFLFDDLHKAQSILGAASPILGDFPNIEFNTVPQLKLVQFIEASIVESQANVIFTHHPRDLNNDHLHTSLACQAASRLFQRRPGVPSLRALYYMEVPSATDWSFPGNGEAFHADTFFPIESTIDKKLAALRAYRGVMREFPHPRSEEVVRGLAAVRGGQSGMRYAEAFQTAFRALGGRAGL